MLRKRVNRLSVAALLAGLCFLTVVTPSALADAGALSPEQEPTPGITYLPLVRSTTCRPVQPLRTPSAFGVQMYWSTGAGVPYFGALTESGTTWVRTELDWDEMEPENVEPSDYNWRHSDRSLAAAAEGGMNMIATIGRNPAWASPYVQGPISEESLDDFAQFLNALVERYDGDGVDDEVCGRVVKHWELYNEPDGGSRPGDVRWGNFGAEYAAMLEVAYAAIKSADPDAQVLIGGIAYDWFEDQPSPGPFVRNFLPDVLEAGGGAYFDIMNFHVYPAFAPNWRGSNESRGPGLYEKTEAVRALLSEYGLEKPIMITEAGAHSNADGTSPSTQEVQASYVVALYTQAVAADVSTLIWFMLYDPPEWYPNKNGLVDLNNPPVRKLAYGTYQRTAAALADVEFERQLTAEEMGGQQILAYRFLDRETGNPLYVIWRAPVKVATTASIELMGNQATLLDIRGNTTVIDATAEGALVIPVTNQPVIVEVIE